MFWVVAMAWPLLARHGDIPVTRCGGALSLLAARALLGHPGAGRDPAQPPSPCPAAVCTGLIPALPSGGIIKGDEGTVRGGLVPPGTMEPVGFLLRACQRAHIPARQRGTAGPRGQKPLCLICPSWEDTEGHSCCGCHRLVISSRETMGAARSSTSHPGGCARSQPVMSPRPLPAPWALADPCPHTARLGTSPEPTPATSCKEKQPETAEISERFMGADLSCGGAATGRKRSGAHGGLEKALFNLCQPLIRGQTLELYLWSKKRDTLLFLKDTGGVLAPHLPQPCAPQSLPAAACSRTFPAV